MGKVTVIGGGGTGLMMAADLKLKGHDVTIFEVEEEAYNLRAWKERGYIEVTGNAINGKADVAHITYDMKEAVEGAECIFVSAMAKRHAQLNGLMAPELCDGQAVCFSAGNCASIFLKEKLGNKKVLVGEMQGNIYPCRLLEDGKLICAFPFREKPVAAFPAEDNEEFVTRVSRFYPCHAVKNVFQATLNSPNLSIHLAGSLLGVTKMETMEDFRLYRDGLCPSVAALIEAVEAEKAQVMEKMGYEMIHAAGQIYALKEYDRHPELDIFRSLAGPTGVHHRYITEDAHAGNSLLVSIAHAMGIAVPVSEGLIAIASALNKEDFYKNGITLENLGLSQMTPDEVNRYLETGKRK